MCFLYRILTNSVYILFKPQRMKSVRTKKQNKEDGIVKITVAIDRCNDKEACDTNGSISSVTGSKGKATYNGSVRNELGNH